MANPSPLDWRDLLSPGHIVAFEFPLAEEATSGGIRPKCRPCLVLTINRSHPTPTATLAYGTGASSAANVGLELHVFSEASRSAAGVRRPTRFVCARRVTVELDDKAFDLNAEGTPILGHLDEAGVERLNVIRATLAATPDDMSGRERWRRRRRGGRRRNMVDASAAAAAS